NSSRLFVKISAVVIMKILRMTPNFTSKLGCRCIKTTSQRVALRTVAKVEVTPPSGRCPGDVSICKKQNTILRLTERLISGIF
uniref:Chemokine interleukin-8-like domain-containing protein n=1 Tax=Poecilia reticulata TaxID=8081 RepID=A0A3P9N6V4_POERE